jgi:hypothetical protein
MMLEFGDNKNVPAVFATGTWTVKEVSLQWLYVHCGRPFVALLDVKANPLTLIKRLEAFALNGTEMYKNIPAFIILNEAKPFFLVEPLYLAFCQSCNPPFVRFVQVGAYPSEIKKTTPYQNRVLNRQWFDLL